MSNTPGPVAQVQGRFRDWMEGAALPYWASHGHDGAGRGFVEHLTLTGQPAEIPFKRMRVQARQIYAFAHAHVLGWKDGLEQAEDAYRFIIAHGQPEPGAWGRTLGRDGGLLDPRADLYDMAFVLLGLAWLARASGREEPLARAAETFAWIERRMGAANGEGYENALPAEPGPRQQNPHMHLLEAMLALFDVSRDARYAEAASRLVGLFRARFFDPRTGTLGEFFTDGLAPAPGEVGSHVEPGHHFEWVWLLHRHRALTGEDSSVEAAALYRFACAAGTDPHTGLAYDVLGRDGRVRHGSSRLWPQTEALKAHLVSGAAPATITRVAGLLLDRYLSHAPAGTWMDQFDETGAPIADRIPSSSLYHLMVAYAELMEA